MVLKRKWLVRILAGGLAGVALHLLIAFLLASITLYGGSPNYAHMALAGHGVTALFGEVGGAVYQMAAMFALGAAVGVATLPFAETWTTMLAQSVLHFVITGGLAVAAAWDHFTVPTILLLYVVIYGLVWAIRWVIWQREVRDIARRLGLRKEK